MSVTEPRDELEHPVPLVVIIGYWLMIAVSFLVGLMLVVGAIGALVGGDSNWTVLGVQVATDADALTIAVYFAVGFAMIGWAVWMVVDDLGVWFLR